MTNYEWYSDRTTGNAYRIIHNTLFACPVTTKCIPEIESACEVELELQNDKQYVKEMMLLLAYCPSGNLQKQIGGHWNSDIFIFNR